LSNGRSSQFQPTFFRQDLQDPYQLTIYDLLLTIVIDYFLLTIDYFHLFRVISEIYA